MQAKTNYSDYLDFYAELAALGPCKPVKCTLNIKDQTKPAFRCTNST